jgi:hypothetical protein
LWPRTKSRAKNFGRQQVSGMAVGKSKLQMKEKVFASAHRHRLIYFFLPCLPKVFVTSFALGLYFLFPAGLWKKAHNPKSACTVLWPP